MFYWLDPSIQGLLDRNLGQNTQKSLVRNRNSPGIFTVTFYERHLWAGLLGWPD